MEERKRRMRIKWDEVRMRRIRWKRKRSTSEEKEDGTE
jgi:hypothetical protein